MASTTKKVNIPSGGAFWLDAQEQRTDIARICGLIALLLVLASFAFDSAMVMDFSRPYQIAQFSQDEYWFLEEIMQLQNLLLTSDFSGVRAFGSPFAYGFPFWLLSAVISMPLHGHVMLMALFLRLVFMGMKYGAFWVVYRHALGLTHKPIFSLLALCLLLVVPGYVFDGKIISPEYLLMLLVALGWSALFQQKGNSQTAAAFCFALAAVIKVNMGVLCLVFPALWFVHAKRDRFKLLLDWGIGAVVPLLLFLFPASPFKEIFAISGTHHVDWGFEYLFAWWSYNALEFDDMLKGGWSVDFIGWPFLLVLIGMAIYEDVRARTSFAKEWAVTTIPTVIWTFYAALLGCFLTSLTSLLHPWFVFAPFMLLLACGCLFFGTGRQGTTAMAAFLVIYAAWFGPRYIARWEHRIHKFEYVAHTETTDGVVSAWIAENCPKARQAVIDYNLLWPDTLNVHLQKVWTLIEVEDFRRIAGDATSILDNVDLLLLKTDRVNALLPPPGTNPPPKVPGAILGNFFPRTGPYYTRTHDFADLSVFAREGVCKK